MNAFERQLRERFGPRVQSGYPLAELTSFQIGGPADWLITVETEAELMYAAAVAWNHAVPCFCLGAGTNLLVSDRGVRGLVIKLGASFAAIRIDATEVVAGAAAQF